MTARPQDAALLPLPKYPTDGAGDEDSYNTGWNECLDSCAAAVASAQAREEELREEVDSLRSQVSVACEAAWQQSQYRVRAQERAERLEEALREMLEAVAGKRAGDEPDVYADYDRLCALVGQARAALSTNAATQTGETNEAAE